MDDVRSVCPKKIVAISIVVLVIICIIGYFGYRKYEAAKFRASIAAMYNTDEVINDEFNYLSDNIVGRNFDNIYFELHKINGQYQELQIKAAETVAPDDQSIELRAQFKTVLKIQSEMITEGITNVEQQRTLQVDSSNKESEDYKNAQKAQAATVEKLKNLKEQYGTESNKLKSMLGLPIDSNNTLN